MLHSVLQREWVPLKGSRAWDPAFVGLPCGECPRRGRPWRWRPWGRRPWGGWPWVELQSGRTDGFGGPCSASVTERRRAPCVVPWVACSSTLLSDWYKTRNHHELCQTLHMLPSNSQLQVVRLRNMFRQHYIAALLNPIASFLILIVLSVFSIQASIISCIVPPDNSPFVRGHILAGSHSLLLGFSLWNRSRCWFSNLCIGTE